MGQALRRAHTGKCGARGSGHLVLRHGHHRLPHGVTFIGQPLWGSIGYTLPATRRGGRWRIGIAGPVLLIGDGAAQLTVQELGTFSREGLSPVIVVVNNDGYTVERMIHGKTAPYNDIVSWSWTDIPTALGVTNHLAFRAQTYGELDDAFIAAAEHRDRMVLDRGGGASPRHPPPVDHLVRPFRRTAARVAESAALHVRARLGPRPRSPASPAACAGSGRTRRPPRMPRAIRWSSTPRLATASATAWLVTPLHRQTNTEWSAHSLDPHHVEELADEHRRVSADSGSGYPRGGGVRMLDPSPRAVLVVELLQDHHFVTVVEGLENPGLPDAGRRRIWPAPSGSPRSASSHRQPTRSRRPRHRAPPESTAATARTCSTISPANTAGMSSTPTASNQSKNTRDRSSSTIGSRLRTPIVTSTRP